MSGEGNSMSQVTNLAFFRARRGQSEALGAALAALVEPTRLEAGCLNYDLCRSVDDADVWFVYENWRSPEGFDAHMLSAHLQAFLKKYMAQLDRRESRVYGPHLPRARAPFSCSAQTVSRQCGALVSR